MRIRPKSTWLFTALVLVSLAAFLYVNVHAFAGARSAANQAPVTLRQEAAREEQPEPESGGRFVLPDTEVIRRLLHAVTSLLPS